MPKWTAEYEKKVIEHALSRRETEKAMGAVPTGEMLLDAVAEIQELRRLLKDAAYGYQSMMNDPPVPSGALSVRTLLNKMRDLGHFITPIVLKLMESSVDKT